MDENGSAVPAPSGSEHPVGTPSVAPQSPTTPAEPEPRAVSGASEPPVAVPAEPATTMMGAQPAVFVEEPSTTAVQNPYAGAQPVIPQQVDPQSAPDAQQPGYPAQPGYPPAAGYQGYPPAGYPAAAPQPGLPVQPAVPAQPVVSAQPESVGEKPEAEKPGTPVVRPPFPVTDDQSASDEQFTSGDNPAQPGYPAAATQPGAPAVPAGWPAQPPPPAYPQPGAPAGWSGQPTPPQPTPPQQAGYPAAASAAWPEQQPGYPAATPQSGVPAGWPGSAGQPAPTGYPAATPQPGTPAVPPGWPAALQPGYPAATPQSGAPAGWPGTPGQPAAAQYPGYPAAAAPQYPGYPASAQPAAQYPGYPAHTDPSAAQYPGYPAVSDPSAAAQYPGYSAPADPAQYPGYPDPSSAVPSTGWPGQSAAQPGPWQPPAAPPVWTPNGPQQPSNGLAKPLIIVLAILSVLLTIGGIAIGFWRGYDGAKHATEAGGQTTTVQGIHDGDLTALVMPKPTGATAWETQPTDQDLTVDELGDLIDPGKASTQLTADSFKDAHVRRWVNSESTLVEVMLVRFESTAGADLYYGYYSDSLASAGWGNPTYVTGVREAVVYTDPKTDENGFQLTEGAALSGDIVILVMTDQKPNGATNAAGDVIATQAARL